MKEETREQALVELKELIGQLDELMHSEELHPIDVESAIKVKALLTTFKETVEENGPDVIEKIKSISGELEISRLYTKRLIMKSGLKEKE